jgi:hypothetical protein
MPRKYQYVAGALAVALLLCITLRLMSTADIAQSRLERGTASKTLLVVAHGLLGPTPTQPLIALARQQYPDSSWIWARLTFVASETVLTHRDELKTSNFFQVATTRMSIRATALS